MRRCSGRELRANRRGRVTRRPPGRRRRTPTRLPGTPTTTLDQVIVLLAASRVREHPGHGVRVTTGNPVQTDHLVDHHVLESVQRLLEAEAHPSAPVGRV